LSKSDSLSVVKEIYKQKGILGFTQGYSCLFYCNLVTGFCYFAIYKYIKNLLIKDKEEKVHVLEFFTSSMVSELLFMILNYPFEILLTRMIVDKKEHCYIGPFDGFKKILKGKVKNLPKIYNGFLYSLVFNGTTMISMFSVIESLREFFKIRYKVSSVNDLDTTTYLFCSIMGGGVSGILTNALDVVYIHKQVNEKFHLKTFLKENGLKVFYQGLGATVSTNVLIAVFYFYAVDEIGKMFNVEL
jgi:hypothetical protein